VLFLNLYAFSLTGGVEKVSKNFVHALSQILDSKQWRCISLHDRNSDIDSKYCPAANYQAFGGRLTQFIGTAIWKAWQKQTLILSHINLLAVARLISVLQPKKRIILFAHGIEVWQKLPKWKRNFIQNKVEIWAVSQFTKQKMIVENGIASQQIKVLNNCLSPFFEPNSTFEKPQYLAEKYGISIENPIIYTLSRLSASEQYKGYDTVIRALALLKKENYPFTYLLAGKADDLEKQRIEQLIVDNQLNDQVKVLGYIPDEEITAHFLLADVFVMPSKGEGFGIVFIEAAACGCQVIGGTADGSADALLNGELGQMIDPNNEIEIMNAIKKAIHNKTHQPKTQQEKTLENFDFQSYLNQIEKLVCHN
jgi:glycosyltransferase involved in cell wall biosynthesis